MCASNAWSADAYKIGKGINLEVRTLFYGNVTVTITIRRPAAEIQALGV